MPRSTKESIINSFYKLIEQKSFEKITVKDIIEDCGVNRKTFYYYFKDIYDLFEQIMRIELDKYVEKLPENASLEESVTGIFEFVEKNKKAVHHIMASSDIMDLKKYIFNAFYDAVVKKYKSKADENGITGRDFKLLVEIFVSSFNGMLSSWLDSGMKPNYREDIIRVSAMLGGSVDVMLSNLKKISKENKK